MDEAAASRFDELVFGQVEPKTPGAGERSDQAP
jgi:hypothetical protein